MPAVCSRPAGWGLRRNTSGIGPISRATRRDGSTSGPGPVCRCRPPKSTMTISTTTPRWFWTPAWQEGWSKSKSQEVKELEAAVSLCASVASAVHRDCQIDLLLAGSDLHSFASLPKATASRPGPRNVGRRRACGGLHRRADRPASGRPAGRDFRDHLHRAALGSHVSTVGPSGPSWPAAIARSSW